MLRMLFKVNRIALRSVVRASGGQGPPCLFHKSQYRGISVTVTILDNSKFGRVKILCNSPIRVRPTLKVPHVPKILQESKQALEGSLSFRLSQNSLLFREKLAILSEICEDLCQICSTGKNVEINPEHIHFKDGIWCFSKVSIDNSSGSQFSPYQAPDFNGKPSEASNVFSFAVVMNEVLNQAPPYREGSTNLDEPDYGVDVGLRPALFRGDASNAKYVQQVNDLITQNWDADPRHRMDFKTLNHTLKKILHSYDAEHAAPQTTSALPSMPSLSLGWRVGAGVATAGLLSASFPATLSFGLLAYGLTVMAARLTTASQKATSAVVV